MDDRIMQAAVRAYEYATSDDDSIPLRGLRAAVSRALDMQREEIAQAIETTVGGYPDNEAVRPKVERGQFVNDAEWAARIAREYGKD